MQVPFSRERHFPPLHTYIALRDSLKHISFVHPLQPTTLIAGIIIVVVATVDITAVNPIGFYAPFNPLAS